MAPARRLARRTYLVDREFQLKYAALLSGAGLLCSLLSGGVVYVAIWQAERVFDGPSRTLAGLGFLIWLIPAIAVLAATALGLWGVLFTHKVAGPLHVMSRSLQMLAAGRYPVVRPLRAGDELRPFFDRFGKAVECLRAREAQEAALLEEVVADLEDVATCHRSRQALASLRELHGRKREASLGLDSRGASEKNAA
jgi:hypothetical protein